MAAEAREGAAEVVDRGEIADEDENVAEVAAEVVVDRDPTGAEDADDGDDVEVVVDGIADEDENVVAAEVVVDQGRTGAEDTDDGDDVEVGPVAAEVVVDRAEVVVVLDAIADEDGEDGAEVAAEVVVLDAIADEDGEDGARTGGVFRPMRGGCGGDDDGDDVERLMGADATTTRPIGPVWRCVAGRAGRREGWVYPAKSTGKN